MAPEVYRGRPFGYESDLYAVGMILYKLLNENRVPFLPDYPEKYSPVMRNQAIRRRLEGENVPMPRSVRTQRPPHTFVTLKLEDATELEIGRIAEIATKAIAADPKERYASASELKLALQSLLIEC